MELENVRWRVEDGVGLVTIDRPRALNALDRRTLSELAGVIDRAAAEPGLRALVVTGAGEKAFVAGADVAELAALSPVDARALGWEGQRVLARLEALGVPTLAAVNGFALGGGLELAMACDLVYASERARLGMPEGRLGLIPGFGGTQRLARRVGLMRAKELLFTCETIDAETARRIGLVLDVFPHAELLARVTAKARVIAKAAPLAVAAAKRVAEAGAALDLAAGVALEAEAFGLAFSTADAREGTRAFLEKRAPSFTGR